MTAIAERFPLLSGTIKPGYRQIRYVWGRERVIRDYLANHPIKKLHIGCGKHVMEGWLNCDYFTPGVVHLDATKRFPIPDSSFDFIFSEHMIEHIPYLDGLNMLRECRRVLKPGGMLRVSTPDLQFLVDLYSTEKTEVQKRYIDWSADLFTPGRPHSDTVVINNFMRFGTAHQFVYDEKTLRASFESAGFYNITRCGLNQSAHAMLRNLENESRMDEGFLRLETFTLEATK